MPQVIIIGGGLAGLTAARQLHKNGIDFQLLEATKEVGGRVKTTVMDGYRLDHGFQVLLTAYPEAKRWLDYDKLDLQKFAPGALLLYPAGKKDWIGDPLRDFSSLFPTLFSNAGSVADKLKMLRLKTRLSGMSVEKIFEQEEKPTAQVLREEYGFSQQMIERFFAPFFSGIFLEKRLVTSRRMFDFVFKMMGENDTAVPNLGMGEIPKNLIEPLPKDSIEVSCPVSKIEGQTVYTKDGSSFTAPNIILATKATSDLLPNTSVKTAHHSTKHLHFLAPKPPIQKPLIGLNTSSNWAVNNICTINKVAPAYVPNGHNLVSLSVVGKTDLAGKNLIKTVKKELRTWFGKETENWEHLHTRNISYALPDQKNVRYQASTKQMEVRKGLYVAGDHQTNGSINAAMLMGRKVAELVTEKVA